MNILLCMPKYIGPFLPGSNGGGAWGWMLEKQFKRLGWNVTFVHSFEPDPLPESMIKEQDIIVFRHSYQVEFRRYKDIVSKARPEALIVHNYIDSNADKNWKSFTVCRETDVWLAQNLPHKKLVESLGFKSQVLHYPVDINKFSGIPRRSKKLLYVGRFCPQKGVESLVESFRIIRSRHPDATLTMKGAWSWGVWEDPQSPDFFAYVKDMKDILTEVGGVTIIDDWTSPGSVNEYYNNSSILIFPVNAEGYGAPTIEAHSAAMPVITSDHESQTEKISEGEDGFCLERKWVDRTPKKFLLPHPEEIADKVDFFFNNMDKLEEFGFNGRLKAIHNYNQDNVMEKLTTYLTKELENKRARIEKT